MHIHNKYENKSNIQWKLNKHFENKVSWLNSQWSRENKRKCFMWKKKWFHCLMNGKRKAMKIWVISLFIGGPSSPNGGDTSSGTRHQSTRNTLIDLHAWRLLTGHWTWNWDYHFWTCDIWNLQNFHQLYYNHSLHRQLFFNSTRPRSTTLFYFSTTFFWQDNFFATYFD